MMKPYQKLIDTINANQKTMVEQLHQFCEINSGTTNLNGLAQMSQTLQAAYKPLADSLQINPTSTTKHLKHVRETVIQHYGDSLLISKRPHLKRRVLLWPHGYGVPRT